MKCGVADGAAVAVGGREVGRALEAARVLRDGRSIPGADLRGGEGP